MVQVVGFPGARLRFEIHGIGLKFFGSLISLAV
jgi:hypothetical protein